MQIIVQKYGGSSIAEPELIKNIARRVVETKQKGNKVVVVVSAMGDTTDELLKMAHQITASPCDRELDMLLSTGEQISIALLVMAINNLGCSAVSLTGSQAGIVTDDVHSKARIMKIDPDRVNQELEQDKVIVVAGYQGITEKGDIATLGRGGSDTTAV
ncbi:MAG TPA: aspartate kinase, partial [Peptococcaceae bacterium]|nr:aspartate kinase [Peptococcaceae bacterium]